MPPGAERQPDGSEIVVSRQELQGDLVGDLESEEHILVDYANAPPLTFTVFESTGTFTGTIEGVGSGTLTFTTSAPENVYDENTRPRSGRGRSAAAPATWPVTKAPSR